MTIDELIKQLINTQLAEQLGKDYVKFRDYIDGIDKRNRENFNEINNLKSDIKNIFERIKDIEQKIGKLVPLETFLKLNENQRLFSQQINGKITELENANKDIGQYYRKLENENNNNKQKIFSLESKNIELFQNIADSNNKIANIRQNYQKLETEYYANSKKIADLESKNEELSKKTGEKETKSKSHTTIETPPNNELFDQTNDVITSFNNWASRSNSMLPSEFTYVTGDFRIRTNQQELTETQEKTKWIINRRGVKTYLLPNPNFFDQMTNLDLYEMDLSMLKEKGKNKIKIITPCEISSSGFIEFKGKLQILN